MENAFISSRTAVSCDRVAKEDTVDMGIFWETGMQVSQNPRKGSEEEVVHFFSRYSNSRDSIVSMDVVPAELPISMSGVLSNVTEVLSTDILKCWVA